MLGIALSWRVERAGPLWWMYVVYLVACLGSFAIPSAVGENVLRIRYAAIPIAVLTLSLRRWRPLPVALGVLALAVTWNVTPILFSYLHARSDPAASRAYWAPAIGYLRAHLTPSYRVEVVDTTGHWAAAYLAEAHIPIARGGYRQDDFPQNELLYDDLLGPKAYGAWLRRLGVRYVVLTSAPADYSARAEAALLRSGRSGLSRVYETPRLTVFAVPRPRPILTGPAPGRVVELTAHARAARPAARRRLPARGALLAVLARARRLPDPPRGRHDDRLRHAPRAAAALVPRRRRERAGDRRGRRARPRLRRRRLDQQRSELAQSSRTTVGGLFSKRKSNSAKPATPLAARAFR